MAVLPWVAAFIFVLLLYNLRELIEQVLMIRITHRLRDNLSPVIADKILNLEYRCFEEGETHDLIGRVGNSPESQFTRVFWGILFIPSYAVAISGYALLFINAGWWVFSPCRH